MRQVVLRVKAIQLQGNGWLFLFGVAGSALLIALLTISYQVLKAAHSTPARNLRSE